MLLLHALPVVLRRRNHLILVVVRHSRGHFVSSLTLRHHLVFRRWLPNRQSSRLRSRSVTLTSQSHLRHWWPVSLSLRHHVTLLWWNRPFLVVCGWRILLWLNIWATYLSFVTLEKLFFDTVRWIMRILLIHIGILGHELMISITTNFDRILTCAIAIEWVLRMIISTFALITSLSRSH